MSILELGLVLLTGVFTGICSGVFGIGGGVVLVPILVLGLKFQQQVAGGTSLVAMLLPVGGLGVWQYYKAGKIGPEHFKYGLIIAVGIFIGTYFGSKISIGLSPLVLKKSFAILMVTVAAKLWFSKS